MSSECENYCKSNIQLNRFCHNQFCKFIKGEQSVKDNEDKQALNTLGHVINEDRAINPFS